MILSVRRYSASRPTHAALTKFLGDHPEFVGATFCPLGASKDSGAVQAYLSMDQPLFPRVSTVEQAAARGDQANVLFLDDFTASGVQATDILGNWFEDHQLTSVSLAEERLPFTDRERQYLRSRRVGFVFVAGWEAGLARIKDAAEKLSLAAEVYAHLRDKDIPFAFSGALNSHSPEEQERFRERCQLIGEELLRSANVSDEKVGERALGYGNRAMLLASGLNVPTQTITCLWKDGTVDGVDWHALLRRRAKH